MASSALANASVCEGPCAMQPGSSGTSATNAWSSSLQNMMISYLLSTLALPQIVPENDATNLLHLVRLRFCAISLKIDLLLDASFAEYMMTSASPLGKTERQQ